MRTSEDGLRLSGRQLSGLRLSVETSIGSIDPREWGRLETSLYQSHPWLSWAERNCGAAARYVLVRDAGGTLVGAVPTYLLSSADSSWNRWYDPREVLTGGDGTEGRRPDWGPTLLIGSVSGYHSDLLVEASLPPARRQSVIDTLVHGSRIVATEAGARAMAMMYASRPAAGAVSASAPDGIGPLLTSAEATIEVTWGDLDEFALSFPRRRRYNIQREIELFGSSGSQIVTSTLSGCLNQVGPLLGNVHRTHGAADTDTQTTAYLASQARYLDDVSTVFLETVDEIPVGFSLCYEWGDDLYVRVVGFDYERSGRFAYFSLAYYLPLEHAIRRGLRSVHLGPGTYQAKVNRGASLEPTWSVVWPPDGEAAEWFARAARPGDDAREAADWLALGDLRAPQVGG